MKLLPAYPSSNSERNDALFQHLGRLFVMHRIQEGNVTLIRKINGGKLVRWP